MNRDVIHLCYGCLMCTTSRKVRPPMTPVPVAGPFGGDVLQLKSCNGNMYAMVFADYLTKWIEVFAMKDQKATTITKLLVEHIIPRHGVPS